MQLYKDVLSTKLKVEEELEEEKKSKDELYKLYKKRIQVEKNKSKKELQKTQKLQEENTYLKTLPSKETKELIAFQHHIGLYAKTAKNSLLDVLDFVQEETFDKQEILDSLKEVALELDKISAINKYITRENFIETTKYVKKDLVKFIDEYIRLIYELTTNKELEISIKTNELTNICKFEPIKINIIIDNLLNNSKKANAKNVLLTFSVIEKELLLEYQDNGKGLDKSIIDIESIFNMGITTTNGSGLGLYHIRELLEEMGNSTIEAVPLDEGIKFLIRFKI